MSQTYIPASLRNLVKERASHCCEYCLVHEDDVLLPHECDHVVLQQHGETEAANLALACIHCNRKKGPNIASVDPETNRVIPLFNPRVDDWDEHIRLNTAYIQRLTSIGRATLQLLDLNAFVRIRSREHLVTIGRYP